MSRRGRVVGPLTLALQGLQREFAERIESIFSPSPLTRLTDEMQRGFPSQLQQFPSQLQRVLAEIPGVVKEMAAPGTFLGDWLRARDGDEAALIRLAERLPWAPHPKSPAWRALTKRARNEGWEVVRQQALMVGLFQALRRDEEPQRIRFGQQYLGNSDGSRLVRPLELPLPLYYRWLRKETINAMEASLLGDPYPNESPRTASPWPAAPLDEALDIADELTPEDVLLQRELEDELRELEDKRPALDAALLAKASPLLAKVSPRERQILLAALDMGTPNLAAIARQLGLAPATVRVMWHRLRRKIAPRM